MTGRPLEQLTKQVTRDAVPQLTEFLIYVQDRTQRADLYEDTKRKINAIYHQVWYFRDRLLKKYANKNDFDAVPEHLYPEYKNEAEQILQTLIERNKEFRTSLLIPDFLVQQTDNVIKKLESLGLPPEGPKMSLGREYYITKEQDQYFYNRAPLKLKIGSQYRLAFDIIFDVTKGKSGVCPYDAFEKELGKRNAKLYKKLKMREGNGVRDWAQDNLTVKSKGVLNKIPNKDLIVTQESVGFVFNNQK